MPEGCVHKVKVAWNGLAITAHLLMHVSHLGAEISLQSFQNGILARANTMNRGGVIFMQIDLHLPITIG